MYKYVICFSHTTIRVAVDARFTGLFFENSRCLTMSTTLCKRSSRDVTSVISQTRKRCDGVEYTTTVPCKISKFHCKPDVRANVSTPDVCRIDVCKDSVDDTAVVTDEKREILNLKVPFPTCYYPNHSRRSEHYRKSHRQVPTKSQYFQPLDGYGAGLVVTVDGMNGCGKSTMMTRTNRKYCKINGVLPDVTAGSDYNLYPINGLMYIISQTLMYSHQLKSEMRQEPCVWDRDRYSNLRFYFVHYLMNEYCDKPIPMVTMDMLADGVNYTKPVAKVYEKLNTLAVQTHLLDTLTFFERWQPSPPSVVIVNHDLYCVARTLIDRGGAGDCFRAKDHNYQAAQYHVYVYFAKILKQPVIDLMFACQTYDLNVDDIQHEIVKRINYVRKTAKTAPSTDFVRTVAVTETPSRNQLPFDKCSALRIQNICRNINDKSVYVNSSK